MSVFAACIHLPDFDGDKSIERDLKLVIYDFLDDAGIDYSVVGIGVVNTKGDIDIILPVRAESPKARSSDPDTSKAASLANLPRRGTQRDLLLEEIVNAEGHGMTAEEAAEATGIRLNAASTRMSELVRGFFIRDSGKRRETSGGQMAIVYAANIGNIVKASKR